MRRDPQPARCAATAVVRSEGASDRPGPTPGLEVLRCRRPEGHDRTESPTSHRVYRLVSTERGDVLAVPFEWTGEEVTADGAGCGPRHWSEGSDA